MSPRAYFTSITKRSTIPLIAAFCFIFAAIGIYTLIFSHATTSGYQIGFANANSQLNWSGSDGNNNFGVSLYPGTHPSITLSVGLTGMFFESASSKLCSASVDGVACTGLAMQPGTSPSLAATDGGKSYVVAFHGANGDLWVMTPGSTNDDTGRPMTYGTNPAVTGIYGSTKYEVAFSYPPNPSDTNPDCQKYSCLWTYGYFRGETTHGANNCVTSPKTCGSEEDPMEAGTSPSIAPLEHYGFEIAIDEESHGDLYTLGQICQFSKYHVASSSCQYNGNYWDPVGQLNSNNPYGSPSIAEVGSSGTSWVVSYENASHQLVILTPSSASALQGAAAGTGSVNITNQQMGNLATPSDGPSITGFSDGSYEIAYQSNTSNLTSYNSNGSITQWGKMFPGSSPSVVDPPYDVTPPVPPSSLSVGQNLYPGNYITSPDGQYSAVLQTNGDFVIYTSSGTETWDSGTSGQPVAYLTLQNNGNLAIFNTSGAIIWQTGSSCMGGTQVHIQDDGNLVVYTSGNQAIWSLGTGVISFPSTLYANNKLYPGQELISPDRSHRLILQFDGNLVTYDCSNNAIWSSKTNGKSVADLAMQGDGNLVLYDPSGNPVPSAIPSIQGQGGVLATLRNDGNFVVYQSSGFPVWGSLGIPPPPPKACNNSCQVVFASPSDYLNTIGGYGNANYGLGMMPGTSPSVSVFSTGGTVMAFQANTGHLWVVYNGSASDTGLGMNSASSPSVTVLPHGGYEVAFESNNNQLWVTGTYGTIDIGNGMWPGTNPSITNFPNGGWEVAFEANTDQLWTAGPEFGTRELGNYMYQGTSPSMASFSDGNWDIAFSSSSDQLWLVGTQGGVGNLGNYMYQGTSPSLTSFGDGYWDIAFSSSSDQLWIVGTQGGVGNLGNYMYPGTSPSLASFSNGNWDISFQGSTGNLWIVGTQGGIGDTGYGMYPYTGAGIGG